MAFTDNIDLVPKDFAVELELRFEEAMMDAQEVWQHDVDTALLQKLYDEAKEREAEIISKYIPTMDVTENGFRIQCYTIDPDTIYGRLIPP